jgi:hypothetical protein
MAGALMLTSVGAAQAAVITLTSDNSTATFHTEASDGGVIGHNSWTVDGVEQLYGHWLWFRADGMTNEAPLHALNHVGAIATNTDFDAFVDTLSVRYDNTGGGFIPGEFQVDLRYTLLGGTAGSQTSAINEVARITNTGDQDLQISLFQAADFDLAGTFDDDIVSAPGGLGNTIFVSDLLTGTILETVANTLPTAFYAGSTQPLFDSLNDSGVTVLPNNPGPYGPGDIGWAYQWDFLIPAGDSVLFSKDENISFSGVVIPEPSSLGLLLVGSIAMMRRRK